MNHHQDAVEIPACTTTGGTSLWLQALWRRLTVSFVLLLGVAVFLTAVGIDSLQQASAADMSSPTAPSGELSRAVNSSSMIEVSGTNQPTTAGSYLEYDLETANRLRHRVLTSASLTGSRLTSSHLFTQQR